MSTPVAVSILIGLAVVLMLWRFRRRGGAAESTYASNAPDYLDEDELGVLDYAYGGVDQHNRFFDVAWNGAINRLVYYGLVETDTTGRKYKVNITDEGRAYYEEHENAR